MSFFSALAISALYEYRKLTAFPTKSMWNIVKVGVFVVFFLSFKFVTLMLFVLLSIGLTSNLRAVLLTSIFQWKFAVKSSMLCSLFFALTIPDGDEVQNRVTKKQKIILLLPTEYDVNDLFTFL